MKRRTFVGGAMMAPAFLQAGTEKGKLFRYAEVEAKFARRDFSGITKDDLPTPSLCVEKSVFDRNVAFMANHCKTAGIDIRSHCKIHKSVDVAKRQIAAGALGICCATVAESELMVGAGIKNCLYTCQPAGKNKIWRSVLLAVKDPTFMVVADDPLTVELLNEAAGAAKIKLKTLVDVHAGLTRAGHAPGAPSVELAKKIDKAPNLVFTGVMGHSGAASHTKTFAARTAKSRLDVGPVVETAAGCKAAGLQFSIVTGGSTGTYNIDKAIGLSELQAGSYVFMDSLYSAIGGKDSDAAYSDFGTSLTVLTRVISRNHAGQVTIDCGNKAMLKPTDVVKGRPEVKVENQGAEYGILKWSEGPGFQLGEMAELITSNLDMTTNCYDRYYVCEGDRVVDLWPIMGRAGALQR
jgi:3-hydroxy-D-aspartate aldolase